MTMWLRRLTVGCAFLLGFGLLWLLAYVAAEATFGEGGGSLVDGYWRGRLPWMGIAEALIVVGATACLVSGGLSVLVAGGWARRVAITPFVALMAGWWLVASIPLPGGAYCPDCPPREADPWAYAYSLPKTTALGFLVPAIAVVFLALARSARKVRELR
jgi:hypothetical protein